MILILTMILKVQCGTISLGAGLIDSFKVPFQERIVPSYIQNREKLTGLLRLRETLRETILLLNHLQHDILINLPNFYHLHG